MTENYSFGMEEEYFIVDAETKSLQRKASPAFLIALKRAIGPSVTREMLQSQLEISTKPALSMADGHAELKMLRQTIGAIAGEHGLSYFAAGTHPTAGWSGGHPTPKLRYEVFMPDVPQLGERNMIRVTEVQ